MSATLLVFIPVALLGIVAAFCFVGCIKLDTQGTNYPPFTEYGKRRVIANPSILAYWRLSELSVAAPAKDDAGPHDGTYTAPADAIPEHVVSLENANGPAAPGTISLGLVNIVPGETLDGDLSNIVHLKGMRVDGGFMSVPPAAVINPAPEFAVELWALREWPDDVGKKFTRVVIDSSDAPAAQAYKASGYTIVVNADGNWEAWLGVDGVIGRLRLTGPAAKLEDPAYIVLNVGPKGAQLCVNAVPVASADYPEGKTFERNLTQPIVIGAGFPRLPPRMKGGTEPAFPACPFRGVIQCVALYSTMLDATTMQLNFDAGRGLLDKEKADA